MSLPYLLLLMGTILLGPKLLLDIYLPAEDWQIKQIAVDNAATVMGKGDRDLFNQIIQFNRIMQGLETAHDKAHLCKNSPWPWVSGPCRAADTALEIQIRSAHATMMGVAKGWWLKNTAEGKLALAKEKVIPLEWDRPACVPVHAETCPICGLKTYIELDKPTPVTVFIRANSRVPIGVIEKVGGRSLKRDSKWNYRLQTGEEQL